MTDDRPQAPRIETRARVASGAAGALVLVIAIAYLFVPRLTSSVAPKCVGGSGCRVDLLAAPDSVILIALLVIAAFFGAMGVTGCAFALTLPGASLGPSADEVKSAPKNAETLKPLVVRGVSDPKADAIARWNLIPRDLQDALLDFGAEEKGLSATDVQLNVAEVARAGSVYYVTIADPRSHEDVIVKLAPDNAKRR